MSRSQKPRTPDHFPRMRYRARKRHEWTVVRVEGWPYAYVGPIRTVRQQLRQARR